MCAVVLCGIPASAQDAVRLEADFTFYGDNTEFNNPFRRGDTLFGAGGSVSLAIDLDERVTFNAGLFGNGRFGFPHGVEQWRPVISIAIGDDRSRFTIGTFDTARRPAGPGPDRVRVHGLLPSLQIETLAFTRPWETGLQWTGRTSRIDHDVWINWQKINTPRRREVFDAGARVEASIARGVALGFQAHIVHHGGQQFNTGPVSDSAAFGPGVIVRALPSVSCELYGLLARYTPDREHPALSRNGAAFFSRIAAERHAWRGHLIVWRGGTFLKEEGDPNYQSARRDGTLFRDTRDYAEAGLTRTFSPAPHARVEASARVHRVEAHVDYSYRIVATVQLGWKIR